jgi:putative ABC transport system permease protein
LGIESARTVKQVEDALKVGQVWRVPAFEPVAFGMVSLLLLAIGLAACYWPARRAARIDPLTVIRGDL